MRRNPTRPWRRPRLGLVVVGLGLALALAACGGSSDGDGVASLGGDGAAADNNGADSAKAAKDPQQQALDFAKCMREHGIDMPDPEVDDQGRIKVRVGAGGAGKRPDPQKLEAAQKACGSLMGGGGDGPAQLDPEDRDAMVAFARCMREHGIDMPDPTGGGLTVRREGDGGIDPKSKEFQEAEKACNHHLANLRPRNESGSGS
jgi:hypothetical protein